MGYRKGRLFLHIFAASFLLTTIAIKAINSSLRRERAIAMSAELDKEKSFDGEKKVVRLRVTARVQKADVFELEAAIPSLRGVFYSFVLEKRGNVPPGPSPELGLRLEGALEARGLKSPAASAWVEAAR
jgi:hypothetical protein